MTVYELIERLQKHEPNATVRFSMADDSTEDAGLRWFCENDIESAVREAVWPIVHGERK